MIQFIKKILKNESTTVIPKINEIWAKKKVDPFGEFNYAKILDIKDGFVQYKYPESEILYSDGIESFVIRFVYYRDNDDKTYIPNTTYIHNHTNNEYTYLYTTNENATRDNWPVTVVYKDKDGNYWSRPKSEFDERYTKL